MSEIVTMQYYIPSTMVILVILSKTQKPEESIFKTNMSILVKISSKSTFLVVFAAETSKKKKVYISNIIFVLMNTIFSLVYDVVDILFWNCASKSWFAFVPIFPLGSIVTKNILKTNLTTTDSRH